MSYLYIILLTFFVFPPIFTMEETEQAISYFQFMDLDNNQNEIAHIKHYLARQKILINHVVHNAKHRKNIIVKVESYKIQKNKSPLLINNQNQQQVEQSCYCCLF